jgi:hypothetical protein
MPLFGIVRARNKHFIILQSASVLIELGVHKQLPRKVEAQQHALPQGTSAKGVVIPFQACSRLQAAVR